MGVGKHEENLPMMKIIKRWILGGKIEFSRTFSRKKDGVRAGKSLGKLGKYGKRFPFKLEGKN